MARNLNIEAKLKGDAAVNKKLKGIGQVGVGAAKGISVGFIAAAAAVAGVMAATRGLKRAFDAAVGATSVQEEAINSLNAALESHGNATGTASQAIQDYAAELQKVTTIGDEVTIGIASQIEAMTGLAEEGLLRATQAAIQLSKAFKIDLKAAASLVGKELTSTTSALTRYGIQIDKTGTQQEQLTELLEGTKAGMAIARAEVELYSGKIIQLQNVYGDLQESIGAFLTQNPEVLTAIDAVKLVMRELIIIIEENRKAYLALGEDSTTTVEDMALVIGKTFGDIAVAITAVGASFTIMATFLGNGLLAIKAAVLGVSVALEELFALPGAGTSPLRVELDATLEQINRLATAAGNARQAISDMQKVRDRLVSGLARGGTEFTQAEMDILTFIGPRQGPEPIGFKLGRVGQGFLPVFAKEVEEVIEEVIPVIRKYGATSSRAATQVKELLTPSEKLSEALNAAAQSITVLGDSWRDNELPMERAATIFERINLATSNAAQSARELADGWRDLANTEPLSLFPPGFTPPSPFVEELRQGLRGLQTETTDLGGGLFVDCVTMPDGSIQCGSAYEKGQKSQPAGAVGARTGRAVSIGRSIGDALGRGIFENDWTSLGRRIGNQISESIGGSIGGIGGGLIGGFIGFGISKLFGGGRRSIPSGTQSDPIWSNSTIMNPESIAMAFLVGTQAAQARSAGFGLDQLNAQRVGQQQAGLAA